MSKYSYNIKFGTGSYATLLPSTSIDMNGEYIDGTYIWRETIGNLKIGRLKNPTIYDTLDSWFSDETKFETDIFIQINKSSVEESVHRFGIKWGRIDQKKKTYEVTPIPYDNWGRYFEEFKDIEQGGFASRTYYAYSTSTYYDLIDSFAGLTFLDQVKGIISFTDSTWSSSDIKSTFLNGDAYPDTSVPTNEYGVMVDYVTGEQSHLHYAGAYWPILQSLSQYLDTVSFLYVKPYFDSNDDFRLEHERYFIDILTSNAVDFSNYLKTSDNVFSYEDSSLPITETISMRYEDNEGDRDFLGYPIIYNYSRNRPDIQPIEKSSDYFANLRYYNDNSLDFRKVLLSSTSHLAYKFFNDGLSSALFDKNQMNIAAVGSAGDAISNNFRVVSGNAMDITIQCSSITGTIDFSIWDRSAATGISNTVSVSTTSISTGVLTPTASADDAYLKISLDDGDNFIGYVVLDYYSGISGVSPNVPVLTGAATTDLKTNAPFSTANIFDAWGQDTRPSRDATYNGTAYTFDNTAYNLRRETVKFFYSTAINPLYGFNDGTRIGKIDKWTRNLDTQFYSIDVLYQEDE